MHQQSLTGRSILVTAKGQTVGTTKRGTDDLREMVIREMTVDYDDALARVFSKAKTYIKIMRTGKVEVVQKEKMEAYDAIRLYLIGRLYGVKAGYIDNEYVSNREIADELGFPDGTVNSTCKRLRDARVIHTIKEGTGSAHRIEANWVEKTLNEIDRKYGNNQGKET